MKRVGLTVSLLALSGLLILALGGLGASARGAVPSVDAGAQAWQLEPNPTVCVEASSTPGGGTIGSRRNPAPIGQTIPVTASIGGADTQFDVTITEVVTGQEALSRLQQANQFNEPPAEGEEYVLFYSKAHITKTGSDQAVFVHEFDWRLVDSTGKILTPPSVVEPDPEFTGNGFEGATIEGWSTFSRKVGEQVSLVFGLQTPRGTGGAWFTVPGQGQTPAPTGQP